MSNMQSQRGTQTPQAYTNRVVNQSRILSNEDRESSHKENPLRNERPEIYMQMKSIPIKQMSLNPQEIDLNQQLTKSRDPQRMSIKSSGETTEKNSHHNQNNNQQFFGKKEPPGGMINKTLKDYISNQNKVNYASGCFEMANNIVEQNVNNNHHNLDQKFIGARQDFHEIYTSSDNASLPVNKQKRNTRNQHQQFMNQTLQFKPFRNDTSNRSQSQYSPKSSTSGFQLPKIFDRLQKSSVHKIINSQQQQPVQFKFAAFTLKQKLGQKCPIGGRTASNFSPRANMTAFGSETKSNFLNNNRNTINEEIDRTFTLNNTTFESNLFAHETKTNEDDTSNLFDEEFQLKVLKIAQKRQKKYSIRNNYTQANQSISGGTESQLKNNPVLSPPAAADQGTIKNNNLVALEPIKPNKQQTTATKQESINMQKSEAKSPTKPLSPLKNPSNIDDDIELKVPQSGFKTQKTKKSTGSFLSKQRTVRNNKNQKADESDSNSRSPEKDKRKNKKDENQYMLTDAQRQAKVYAEVEKKKQTALERAILFMNPIPNIKMMKGSQSGYGAHDVTKMKRMQKQTAQEKLRAAIQQEKEQLQGMIMLKNTKPVKCKVTEQEREVQDYLNELTGFSKTRAKKVINKPPGAPYSVQELIQLEEMLLDDNGTVLDKRFSYSNICKESNLTNSEEKHPTDPEFLYFIQCNEDSEVPLPILARVQNKSLSLANYTLSAGHCKALNRAGEFFDNFISRVRFDNCGIDDFEFSNLLMAINKLKDFKSIIYRFNEFSYDSLENLKPILYKQIPQHLQELRISNCRMVPQVADQLLDALLEKCFLQKLELRKANFSDQSFMKLCQFLQGSKYLNELDISWNDIRPSTFEKLLQVLAKNRKIQTLNLSWNNLIEQGIAESIEQEIYPLITSHSILDSEHQNLKLREMSIEEIQEIEVAAAITNPDEKENAYYQKQILIDQLLVQREKEMRVANFLYEFIKKNKNLIHLDLTSTGLSYLMLKRIVESFRYAKSLMSVHLSGNPGISEGLKEYICDHLKCKKPQPKNHINFNKILKDPYKANGGGTDEGIIKLKQESIKIKQIMAQKRLENNGESIRTDQEFKCILTRILGFKSENPGSGQWTILTKDSELCWVCDRKVYGFILWHEDMHTEAALQTDSEERKAIGEAIGKFQTPNDTYTQGHPHICGPFTNWKQKKMYKLVDYFQLVNPKEAITNDSILEAMCEKGKFDERILFELREKNIVDDIHVVIERLSTRQLRQFLGQAVLLYKKFDNWKRCLERIYRRFFKRPKLINGKYCKDKTLHQLYICPAFLDSGRLNYTIQVSKDENFAYDNQHKQFSGETHLYKSIVDFREEDLAPYRPEMPITLSDNRNKQELAPQTFQKWQIESSKRSDQECLNYDSSNWANKEICKHEEDEQLQNFIQQHFPRIKEIFLQVTSSSPKSFPEISISDFIKFCHSCNIFDENVSEQMVTEYFTKNEHNIPNLELICRHQFFEFLFRISLAKYKKTKSKKASSEEIQKHEAFKMLLDNEIYPAYPNDQWQQWRKTNLWQNDINEIMQANMPGIKKIYESYLNNGLKKYMSYEDCLNLMCRDSEVKLTVDLCTYAYGMSKMNIVREKDMPKKSEVQHYMEVEFVEFLEFIGRSAHAKFADSELESIPLVQKLVHILDLLLPLVEMTRVEINEDDDQDESEPEHDDY